MKLLPFAILICFMTYANASSEMIRFMMDTPNESYHMGYDVDSNDKEANITVILPGYGEKDVDVMIEGTSIIVYSLKAESGVTRTSVPLNGKKVNNKGASCPQAEKGKAEKAHQRSVLVRIPLHNKAHESVSARIENGILNIHILWAKAQSVKVPLNRG